MCSEGFIFQGVPRGLCRGPQKGEGWVFLKKSMENGLFIAVFALDRCFLVKLEKVRQVPKISTLGVPKFFKMGAPKGVFYSFFSVFKTVKATNTIVLFLFSSAPRSLGLGFVRGTPAQFFFE